MPHGTGEALPCQMPDWCCATFPTYPRGMHGPLLMPMPLAASAGQTAWPLPPLPASLSPTPCLLPPPTVAPLHTCAVHYFNRETDTGEWWAIHHGGRNAPIVVELGKAKFGGGSLSAEEMQQKLEQSTL